LIRSNWDAVGVDDVEGGGAAGLEVVGEVDGDHAAPAELSVEWYR
jgi:hypothetical protein